MTWATGIDIGGSKIAAAVIETETGRVVRAARDRTPDGAEAILRRCRTLVGSLGAAGLPVGVSVCELVDRRRDIASAYTVDLRGVDLGAELADLGPVVVESDVRAAALAEARIGAAAGADVALVVSAGTGLSCCLLLDGRPHLGSHGHAILLGAPPIEEMAGGAAIARRAREAGLDPLGATAEMDAIRAEAGAALGAAVACLVNALDPSVVVFSGGLATVEAYVTAAIAATRRGAEVIPGVERPVLVSPLGADAAVIGAALLAAEGWADRGLPGSAWR